MKKLKNFLRPIHLFLGLLSGLVVFIISITGAIYCFEKPIRSLLYSNIMKANNNNLPRHSLSKQLEAATDKIPDKTVKFILVKKDKDQNTEVYFNQGSIAFVNPYTLQIFDGSYKKKDLMTLVLRIHRNLGLGKVGKLIVGFSTLIFLIMLLSGIVLWWPSNKKRILSKFMIAKSSNTFKSYYDWHNVLGFYSFWILIWMVITGVIWSFSFADQATGYLLKPKVENTAKQISFSYFDSISSPLDNTYNFIQKRYPESNEQFIFLTSGQNLPQKVFIKYKKAGFFNKQDKIFFNTKSGIPVKESAFNHSNIGFKLLASQTQIHTGEILGLLGQCLAFFGALIGASLPITGFLMWYKKRKMIAKK